jgi:hypothetical protein
MSDQATVIIFTFALVALMGACAWWGVMSV